MLYFGIIRPASLTKCLSIYDFTGKHSLNYRIRPGQNTRIKNTTGRSSSDVTISISIPQYFAFKRSSIPSSLANGVFIPQLIRVVWVCSSYDCFILRAMWFFKYASQSGSVKEWLELLLKKFYGWYLGSHWTIWSSSVTNCSKLVRTPLKRFTSRLLKLSFSLSMHLLRRMNVMLDFIWTLHMSSCEEHGTSEHYKKCLPTVGFEPPTPHGLQITSPPL